MSKSTTTEEVILEIYQRNKKGEPLKTLREEFGLSEGQFRHGRERLGLPALNNKNRVSINKNFFENIDTEIKSYYLGFLYADGFLHQSGPKCISVNLNLKESDEYILYPLRDAIAPNKKIYANKKMVDGRLFVCKCFSVLSIELANDLMKWGMHFRKSTEGELKIPDIEPHLIRHFIRGYFDGNGHICKSNVKKKKLPVFSLGFMCAKEKLLLDIGNWFYIQNQTINKSPYLDKYNRWYLDYCSKQNIKDVGDILYRDSNYFLKRKYERYQEFLNLYGNPVVTNILTSVSTVESSR